MEYKFHNHKIIIIAKNLVTVNCDDLLFISYGDESKWRGKSIVVKMVKQEQNSCGATFCYDPVMPFFTFSFNHHPLVMHT